MSARESILARIRARQGKPPVAADAERETLRAYLDAHASGPRPLGDWETVSRFLDRARGLGSTVEEVESIAAVPAAAARYLTERSLPLAAPCWAEFARLDWQSAGVAVEARTARDTDLVAVSGAYCAIAETGTLMMLSGAATPATHALLPESHIAVVSAARVVRDMEEAWRLLRAEHGRVPRAVSFISGPSRTADIEQTVTLGAHGPYRVHVLLVRSSR